LERTTLGRTFEPERKGSIDRRVEKVTNDDLLDFNAR
jgi:hypothetical protein